MATIITKNSSTTGNIPSTLEQGELAINVTDGKLFYGNGIGVAEFTGSGGGGGGTVNTGSLLTTASFSTPNITFTKGNGSTFGVDLTTLVPTNASNTSTIDINVFGSDVESYLLMSNVAGTTGVAIGGDADLRYNSSTNKLSVGSVSATSLTGSLQGTSSWANSATSSSFALTASLAPNYVLNSATSSFVTNSQTSSFVLNSVTASMLSPYVLTSVTASMLSSYVLTSTTSSMSVATASFVTSSKVFGPNGADSVLTSSYAVTASYFSGTVTSASHALTASATQLQGGSGTPLYPGTYFYPNETTTVNQNINAGGSADSSNIRYYPFVPSQDTKITAIGKHVRGALTTNTGSYRLGIYASVQGDLGSGPVPLPGALVGDYGVVSFPGTTPAFVEITISAGSQPTLSKGKLYWLTCSPSGSTTFANGPANATQFNKFMGQLAPSATAFVAAYVGLQQATDGGAALPNPAATSSLQIITSSGLVLAPFLKISGSTLSY